jgi:L-ascorbate metabolism protein UlaG (beta-lactamase superfamily)
MPRLHVVTRANCTAVTGRDSVLLVDPLIAPAYAKLVETALRSKTSLPVRHVVLTHHHTEILDDQSRYHRAASAAATADELRSRCPAYLLEEVLPQSVRAWKRHAAS